jgi:hypothetical protein
MVFTQGLSKVAAKAGGSEVTSSVSLAVYPNLKKNSPKVACIDY